MKTLALIIVLTIASQSYAQSCPGGICLLPGVRHMVRNAVHNTVRNTRTVVRNAPVRFSTTHQALRGHWSYSGTISNHLRNEHGMITDGMTQEQMLQLHNAIHEGTR